MGNGEKVLVIGRNTVMLQKIVGLLKLNKYDAVGTHQNNEAISLFEREQPKAVIIGGGVDNESRKTFHTEFLKRNKNIKLIDAQPQTVLYDLQKTLANNF